MTVRELIMRTEIPESTIRKNLKAYAEMKRIKIEELNQEESIPVYVYVVEKKWMNVR